MNLLRATGVPEVLITVVAMAFGAAFVFLVFQLGEATRPGEMRVWGSTETATSPSSSSSSSGSASSSPSGSTVASGGAAVGKASFDKNCGMCHPGGNKGVGPALNAADFKQRFPQDSDVVKVIRGGKGAMPAISSSTVSDSDLSDIVKYIRSLSGG